MAGANGEADGFATLGPNGVVSGGGGDGYYTYRTPQISGDEQFDHWTTNWNPSTSINNIYDNSVEKVHNAVGTAALTGFMTGGIAGMVFAALTTAATTIAVAVVSGASHEFMDVMEGTASGKYTWTYHTHNALNEHSTYQPMSPLDPTHAPGGQIIHNFKMLDSTLVSYAPQLKTVDLLGTARGNSLSGNELTNTIHGGGGVDHLNGAAGRDFLYGGDAGDRLYGGLGNDLLVGGAGLDRLTGGGGADTFVLGGGDSVRDFTVNDDVTTGLDEIATFKLAGKALVSVTDIRGNEIILDGEHYNNDWHMPEVIRFAMNGIENDHILGN